MNTDEELDLETESTESTETSNKIDTNQHLFKAPKAQQVSDYMQQGLVNRAKEADSMAKVLGRFDADVAIEAVAQQTNDITTLDAIQRNRDGGARVGADGLYLAPVPQVDKILGDNTPEGRAIYENNFRKNETKLQLITDEYKKSLERSKRSAVANVLADTAYIAGSGVAGITDIVTSAIGLIGMGSGMLVQTVGTLGGKDNMVVDFGVFLQDLSVQELNAYNNWVNRQLQGLNASSDLELTGEIARTAVPVATSVLATVATGGAASGSVAAAAASRGVSTAVAKRLTSRIANQAAKKIASTTAALYASSATQEYLGREAQGKTSQEYKDYLREKTGLQILSDAGWGLVVGYTNYYLEKAFGAEASISRYFGRGGIGLTRAVSRSGLEEGATEVLQDTSLNVADYLRYLIGNEDRGMTLQDVYDNFVSEDTLKTFIISAAMGGISGAGEYATTRSNIVKEFKANAKKAFPNATEEQLENAGKAFINSTEENVVNKVRRALMADDQLQNQYGIYNSIVRNRFNELIDQSVAQGKELAFKDKSPEYQAQYIGSVSQRFVDELYTQAVMRGVPVSEVFDTTQMQVENGILYMYGTEYGRRPLSQFTKEMTPAQWYKAQQEARIADALQKKQKEQQKAIREAERQARQAEKERLAESKKQASDEQAVPHRNYLLSVGVESTDNLTNREAIRDARIMARAEIRDMDTDIARGILATIRPDLPTLTMKNAEIKQILRGEIDRYIALDGRENIQALAPAPSMLDRQKAIVERPKKRRIAKPKSFSQRVKENGISKDMVERLGLVGEFKKILGDNYRFYVRKNGTINNMEEFVAEYATEDNSYQGTVNSFIDLFERDLQTKDIYSPDDETALKNWQENSIRAEREQQGAIQDELLQAQTYLAQNNIDTTGMSNEQILSEAQKIWNQNNPELMDSDITVEDLEEIPDEFFSQNIKEITELADENARLDDIYPAYDGETIEVDGKERTVYNSNGDRIAKSKEALTNFWRWFGDSKVVDEQGRPLVVYHGSDVSGIEVFDNQANQTKQRQIGAEKGYFFTDSKKVAERFRTPEQRKAESKYYAENTIIEPVTEEKYDAQGRYLGSVHYTKTTLPESKNFGLYPVYLKAESVNEYSGEDIGVGEERATALESAKQSGKDGVIIYKADTGAGIANEYIVFDSTQIKSVDNRGTYSSDTGNIYRQKTIGAWNPLRKTIELGTGANETTLPHELSHFWLDNMMMYSRMAQAAQNEGFARVWNNIKRYLDIDDRQDVVNVAQAEKYTSAYMQYIRNNKTAPVSDLGFKGLDEYIGDISLDYFENALHKEQDGSYTSELEELTPEIVDALQALTTTDLQKYKDIIIDMQMSEATSEDITDAKLGAEATPEQMRSSGISEMRAQQNKQIEQGIKAAEADAQPIETPKTTAEMKTAEETNAKIPSSRYEIGTTDTESFAKAREIIAKDRNLAEQIIAENPDGITDGIANEFIALELAQQAVQQGKNAMPYLESFVNGASAAGANLRVASLLNTPEFAWAKDMYEASKARDYALALRMRPGVKNALMRKSAIVRAMESKLDEYVETLYPQLLQAQSYEEQVKLINDWGNNVAKEIGVQPSTELWYQTVGGNVGVKKTDFSKAVDYQKRKLKEFLKSKIGATLSDTEQLKVRELHRNAIDALRVLNTDPNNREKKIEFIKQTRTYQDYLNALQPANWATALFASIPRASMLFRISTQVKNTLGTRVEILLSDINRNLRYGTGNLISDKDITAEIKDSMDMFSIGGFSPDVQESFFESPTLAWGEKQFSLIARGGEKRGAVFSKERLAQDAKDIAEYARNNWKSDDPTYKKAWGATKIALGVLERTTGKSFDILAYSDAFMKADIAVKESAKMATFIAKTEGKEKGWTNEQMKARAYELFADARSFIPKTTVGQSIRKRAVEQAKLETFIKSGTLSQVANNIRNSLNLGKESGIGTFIAPFVSTPANVMQLGVDYATGWWRRFGTQTIKTKDGKTVELGWKECKQRIIDNIKAGKPINEYDMQYLEKGYRGSFGGLFLLTMMALFAGAKALGDGDEIDYVPPYQSLSARERQYYKAVNGGKYNCLKILDVWVNAEYFGGLSEAITALGTWYHNNSIISSLTTEIMRAPVIGDLIQTKQDFDKDIQYNKSLLDSAFEGAESQLKKYIPGIIQDIDRAREKGALYAVLGGSLGITTDSEVKAVKDAQTESGASYTPITRGKGFKELDQATKRKINREFDELYNADVAKWLKTHKNAKPEAKKKALNDIRKNISTKLKRKYKIK